MNSCTLLKAANRTSRKTWNAIEGFDGEFAYLHDLSNWKIVGDHDAIEIVHFEDIEYLPSTVIKTDKIV